MSDHSSSLYAGSEDDESEINQNHADTTDQVHTSQPSVGVGRDATGLTVWDKARNTVQSQREQILGEITSTRTSNEALVKERLDKEEDSLCSEVNENARDLLEKIDSSEKDAEESGDVLSPPHIPKYPALLLLPAHENGRLEESLIGPRSLIGPLFAWPPKVSHRKLPLLYPSSGGEADTPTECLYVDSSPSYFLELCGVHGLYVIDEHALRRQVGKRGQYHWGGCLSGDQRFAYCTTKHDCSILKYCLDTPCDPKLVSDIQMQGAEELGGIAYSAVTDLLAVADKGKSKITVLRTDGTQVIVINTMEGGVRLLWSPVGITWDSTGRDLFVADYGAASVQASIARLQVFPCKVRWHVPQQCIGVLLVLDDFVYMIENEQGSKRISVVSAEDGRSVGAFNCPGRPLSVGKDRVGEVIVVSYELP